LTGFKIKEMIVENKALTIIAEKKTGLLSK